MKVKNLTGQILNIFTPGPNPVLIASIPASGVTFDAIRRYAKTAPINVEGNSVPVEVEYLRSEDSFPGADGESVYVINAGDAEAIPAARRAVGDIVYPKEDSRVVTPAGDGYNVFLQA